MEEDHIRVEAVIRVRSEDGVPRNGSWRSSWRFGVWLHWRQRTGSSGDGATEGAATHGSQDREALVWGHSPGVSSPSIFLLEAGIVYALPWGG